jgi:hypothetical protein
MRFLAVALMVTVILTSTKNSYSQTIPKEGSTLNYRIIGFSFPSFTETCTYRLEIASGNYDSPDSFAKHTVLSIDGSSNRMIAEVPAFGCSYTWRAVYINNNKILSTTQLHHFSTLMNACVDTTSFRLLILHDAEKHKDAYVFADDSKTLYDMKGQPVWFLPNIEGIAMTPRDIKLSPQGTITFLFDKPYEVNYNGEVLWKPLHNGAVSKDESEHYHHEFTRMANGHYMVMGQDSTIWGTNGAKTQFGTLIEYDEKGEVAWSWRSSDYFTNSDLKYFPKPADEKTIDIHQNSFYFDETNNYIYVSYKNISRVLKVKYPEGNVVGAYGESFKPGSPEKGNGLFCGQHAISIAQNGNLCMYNNNSCSATDLPKVMELELPHFRKGKVKAVWAYDCSMDDLAPRKKMKDDFVSGGNVVELPDQSVFVCMSSVYSKLFIVSPEKQILWSAIPEFYNKADEKWLPLTEFKASMIYNKADLEKLIWNAELPSAKNAQ